MFGTRTSLLSGIPILKQTDWTMMEYEKSNRLTKNYDVKTCCLSILKIYKDYNRTTRLDSAFRKSAAPQGMSISSTRFYCS